MNVRNERLYAFLRHFFKRVRVQNAGMPFRYRTVVRDGKKEIKRIESGEEYAICCPVCKEKRFRLNVNHVFGETIDGVEMSHMAHCWNEDCEVTGRLLKMYEEFLDLMPEELNPVVEVEQEDGPFSLERVVEECRKNLMRIGGVSRIDTLQRDHPAVRYLAGRNFDPTELGLQYGIGYCYNRDYDARMAHKRLIIPILYRGNYVGWQARAIEGLTDLTRNPKKKGSDWPYFEAKYWTSPGSRKSFFLYSYDLASRQNTVVIAEGPTDAWRIGACGVASLGRRISLYQRKLIAETWGERSGLIVLIGDPGFEEDWQKNRHQLNEEVGEPGKVVLILPKEKDPGSMTRRELWEIIYDRCPNAAPHSG